MATSSDSLHERLRRAAVGRPPVDLVENRVSFGAERAEFAVYDTFRPAERVPLSASNPLYCGMVTGAKRVHTHRGDAIEFLPMESLVVPSNQQIEIDFPSASDERPTKCLTIEIDRSTIRGVVATLNEQLPRHAEAGEWVYDDEGVVHFHNPPGFDGSIQQLVGFFVEDHPDKDKLIELGVQELVVRMLRLEARRLLLEGASQQAHRDPLSAAVQWARAHLHEALSVSHLAAQAHMSEATFYRYFRAEFGVTPLTFLTEERVSLARRLLLDRRNSVSDVAFAVGFTSPSHFIRVFAKHEGVTPKQFQLAQQRVKG